MPLNIFKNPHVGFSRGSRRRSFENACELYLTVGNDEKRIFILMRKEDNFKQREKFTTHNS